MTRVLQHLNHRELLHTDKNERHYENHCEIFQRKERERDLKFSTREKSRLPIVHTTVEKRIVHRITHGKEI